MVKDRIQVNLDDEQVSAIRKLKGFGKKKAEIIKNIVIAYLSEKDKIG